MANIKDKNLDDLSDWNVKELRKLRINLKNRIESLTYSSKPKELQKGHPLAEKSLGECKEILERVQKAERDLCK